MPDHPRHLLTLWSPSYSGDALDAHLDVLLRWAGEHAAGRAERDDVYVWWAKIRSQHRDGRLPHHADVLALDAQIGAQVETHLYLTDYRSLYVADVGEVTDDDVREMAHLLVLMSTVWGRVPVHSIRTVDCDGFECLTVSQVDDSRRRISLGVESGDYIVRSRYPKVSRARDGSLISFTIYWDSLLDRLHTGDVARGKYRVLWDALCLALILLSLRGMVLWLAPTLRRERRKQE